MTGSTGPFQHLRGWPRNSREVWQAEIVPVPGAWVAREGQRHVWSLAIVSGPEGRRILGPDATPDDPAEIQSVLARFAREDAGEGRLPARIQVRGRRLATALVEVCQDLGICLEEPRELPLLDELRGELAEDAAWIHQPALRRAPGVDPEMLRSFADAVFIYRQKRPWMLLGSDDLLHVPSPPSPFPWVLVQPQSIVLFEGPEDLDDRIVGTPRRPYCELHFRDEARFAAADHDLWKELDLPVADGDSWPTATVFSPEEPPRAPQRPLLSWLEGLLRALAASREEDVAAGSWRPEVPTSSGRIGYEMELPSLVEVLEDLATDELPEDPEERALDLVAQARLSVGRARIHLAREALRSVPDDPEALLILADECPDPELRVTRYTEALEASERREGPATAATAAEDGTDDFIPASLRARHGLALALEARGRHEEALEHMETLQALDPADRLEIFETTLTLLLAMRRDEEARAHLGRHREHPSSVAHYGAVLVALRLESDRALPRLLLERAVAFNPFVPRLLLAERGDGMAPFELVALQEEAYDAAQTRTELYGLPFEPSPAQRHLPRLMDAANEAMTCAQYLGAAWGETAGALEWLAAQAAESSG
jgi:tetratricopeptide (TPR) repeat protein